MARDSRKIFRLFRSFQEIKNINDKLKDLIWKKDKIPILFEIFSRVGYLGYWIMDNLVILGTMKIISDKSINQFSYFAHIGWVLGISLAIIKCLYELLSLLIFKNDKTKEDVLIKKQNTHVSFSNFNNFSTHSLNSSQNNKEINRLLIELIGRFSNLVPATSGCGLDKKILGYEFNDGFVGLCGLISALISIMSLWGDK